MFVIDFVVSLLQLGHLLHISRKKTGIRKKKKKKDPLKSNLISVFLDKWLYARNTPRFSFFFLPVFYFQLSSLERMHFRCRLFFFFFFEVFTRRLICSSYQLFKWVSYPSLVFISLVLPNSFNMSNLYLSAIFNSQKEKLGGLFAFLPSSFLLSFFFFLSCNPLCSLFIIAFSWYIYTNWKPVFFFFLARFFLLNCFRKRHKKKKGWQAFSSRACVCVCLHPHFT